MSSLNISGKNQYLWSDYLTHENEPKIRKKYEVTPELEEELLEHGVFLKQRVWRNMRKFQRYNAKLTKRQRKEARMYKMGRLHDHGRLAHF